MKCATIPLATLVVVLVAAGPLEAGHLAPVHPLVAGGDHNHENHSGDFHVAEFVDGINLSSADLSSADLTFTSLGSTNLSNADLSSADLTLSSFVFANLSSANLSSANLTSATFVSTDLSSADLRNSLVSEAINASQLQAASSVTGVNLSGNDLSNFDLSGLGLSGADLSSADLSSADLSSADLRNSMVSEAISATQLQAASSVTGVNLSGNDLSSFDLSGLGLSGADFSSANLSSADLSSADLRNSNVSDAITDTQLQSASNVAGVNLSGNDLSGFDLSGLGLSGADLSSANLSAANLTGANLTGANLHLVILPASMPSLPVISGAVVLVDNPLAVAGQTTVEAGGLLSINTASFTTGGLDLSGGLVSASGGYSQSLTGNGNLVGEISGAADKTITATGTLALGDLTSTSGFDFAGTLTVGANQVSLNDADSANLGVTTTLAAGGNLATINGAELGGGESLSATGSASVDGNFTNNGTVNGPGGGATLTFIDDVDGTGSYTGDIAFSDAFNPGASPAAVSFDNVTFDSSAELNMELMGTTPGSGHDQVNASLVATLDGTLNLIVLSPFMPMPGQSFEIITAATLSGQFATVNGEFVDSSVFLLPTYTATSLILSGRIPGDGNLNGEVEAADYTVWANGFGPDTVFTTGDYNGNGMTDAGDYTIWANNFGQMVVGPETAAAAVPEPGTLLLFSLGLIGLTAYGWRPRRREWAAANRSRFRKPAKPAPMAWDWSSAGPEADRPCTKRTSATAVRPAASVGANRSWI